MKRIILVGLVAVSFSVKAYQDENIPSKIEDITPALSQNEEIKSGISKYISTSKIFGNDYAGYLEHGMIGDIQYYILHNENSAAFGENTLSFKQVFNDGWLVFCSKDTITDKKHCVLGNNSKDFGIEKTTNGELVVLGSLLTDYNYERYARIDKNKAVVISNSKNPSPSDKNIINQILNGSTIYTRYFEKGSDNSVDGQLKTKGLKEALNYMRYLYKKI